MGAGSLKFEIIDKIGHGQFSTVYRAKWINPPDLTMSAPLPSEAYYHSGRATFINAQVQRQQREQEQQHHHHHHHHQQQQQQCHPIGRPVAREANALGNHNHFIDLSGQHNNNQHQSQMNENHSNNNSNNNTHHHHQYQNSSSFNNDTNNNNGSNTNLKRNERFVALKRIKFYDIQNSKARMDYLKEVNLLQQVKHPNIINFNISFIERNELYIVLELADGGDLSKLIRYFQKKKRLIPEQSILKYFTQVCSAVEYIHSKRILHRDIKPANIFMTSNGCVKLGDFGLGRFFSQNTRDAHSIVGTFYYMSPERIQESGYSFSSDVWSLGCVLYELITLNSPFSILNHEQHINDANYYDAQAPPQQQQQQQQQQQNNPYNLQWLIDRIIRAEYPSLDGYTNISPRLRHLANECLNPVQEARPNMQYVCAVVNETYQLFQNSVTPPMTPLI